MGYPDPPFIPPAAAGPDWPPDGLAGSGENAHRLVSELTGGAPKPVSVDDAFGVVFSKLAKDPVNADLIGQLEGLRLAIVERLETQRAARLADLQVQHTETYSACRAALDKRDALQNKLNAQATHLNAAGERLSRARSSWMAARQRRPQNYPTWDEIEAWKGEVAQAQARVDSEEKAYNELMAQQADLARQLAEAAKELERVTAEEAALKARLEGKPYSGTGDFGLIRQPESD
jgi:signal transduction histidine kinase